jgi:hypothetical protein
MILASQERHASRRGVVAGWRRAALNGFRTAVSLHSHTSLSRETLDFIPRFAAACPPVEALLRRYEQRYHRLHGTALNYMDAWWTPPLCPREAFQTECAQIRRHHLMPLVSITDHNSIEAPLLLRILSEGRRVPISLEWTLPWRGVIFHLGIHNLGSRSAAARVAAMHAYTARPDETQLPGLLDWMAEPEDALVVFNHPYWDEKVRGGALQAQRAEEFLRLHRRWIHALELNGLRPWAENRRVMELAAAARLPYVSGGDRHGCEPNALLNLTNAASFSEFVDELREDGFSRVAIMPQYREPLTQRVLGSIADVMRENRAHSNGWTHWSDRVFFRRCTGEVAALSSLFRAGHEPLLIRAFVAGARLLDCHPLRAALRSFQQPEPDFEL